jgi:hypothetical protein
MSMRRIAVVALVAIVIGGVAWAIWPATTWPQSFCAPIERVVGTDADVIARSFSHPEPTLTAAQDDQVHKLRYDITLAVSVAPNADLHAELIRYRSELGVLLSKTIVTDAMSQFRCHPRWISS